MYIIKNSQAEGNYHTLRKWKGAERNAILAEFSICQQNIFAGT
jgi:hypothetical protein